MKIFKCPKCGKIVEIIDGSGEIFCCNEKMIELQANTEEASLEKHIPLCEINDDIVTVKIGEVMHPMDENHYISLIIAEYPDSIIRYHLKSNDEPIVEFDYEKGMTIYEYCTVHGLWKKEL